MIQRSVFSTGGFVLHKIKGRTAKTKYSAWYDEKGKLLDCERITNGVSYPVSLGVRGELARLGPVYL